MYLKGPLTILEGKRSLFNYQRIINISIFNHPRLQTFIIVYDYGKEGTPRYMPSGAILCINKNYYGLPW